MKALIEKAKSKENEKDELDEYGREMDPWNQILSINYDKRDELQLQLRKKTIANRIRAIFGKQKQIDQIEVYGSKGKKIIQGYIIIPEEIEKKKQELSQLKWNEVLQKRRLKKEIASLEERKAVYTKDVVEWNYGYGTENKPKQVNENWQRFYRSHEKEMMDWIDYKRKTLAKDLTGEQRTAYLEAFCEDYFQSLALFNRGVNNLEKDIKGNVDLVKTIYGKDYQTAKLPEILQDLRNAMNGKLVPDGMREFRRFDIAAPIGNIFFSMNSKGKDVEADMEELASQYEELKQIKDQDQYVDKAVSIFQRFIQIHPYQDGNGRTSRALLDIMFINKGIVPPVLYETYYERKKLDDLSNEYLTTTNKKSLQDYIKEQIRKEQSEGENIVPNVDKTQYIDK